VSAGVRAHEYTEAMRSDLARALFAAHFVALLGVGCRDRPAPVTVAPPVEGGATDEAAAALAPAPDPFVDNETPFARQPLALLPAFRPDPIAPRGRSRAWPRPDHLDVAYTVQAAPGEVPAVVGNVLLVPGEGEAWIGDATTGARGRSLKPWPTDWMLRRPGAALSAGEGAALLLRQEEGRVVAHDPTTGARRFVAELYTAGELARRPPGEPHSEATPRASFAASTGSVVVVSVGWNPTPAVNSGSRCEHIGLDAASGAILWRRKTQYACGTVTASAGRVVLLQDALLVSLEAATGRVLWEHYSNDPADPEFHFLERRSPLLANERFVVLWGSRDAPELVVLDAERGVLVSKGRPFGKPQIELADAVLEGSRLHALVQTERSHRRFLTLTSVNLSTTRVGWQAPPVEEWVAHNANGTLIVDDDAVFACTPDGTLRAHDPAQGTVLWSWGVGECGYVDALRPTANAPAVLLARLPTGFAGFVRGPHVPRSFRTIVDGTISLTAMSSETGSVAVPVRIGPVLARASTQGSFRAEVQGRGFIRVEPWLAAACDNCSSTIVLDGSHPKVSTQFSFISDGP
jgi:hypothetical protein